MVDIWKGADENEQKRRRVQPDPTQGHGEQAMKTYGAVCAK